MALHWLCSLYHLLHSRIRSTPSTESFFVMWCASKSLFWNHFILSRRCLWSTSEQPITLNVKMDKIRANNKTIQTGIQAILLGSPLDNKLQLVEYCTWDQMEMEHLTLDTWKFKSLPFLFGDWGLTPLHRPRYIIKEIIVSMPRSDVGPEVCADIIISGSWWLKWRISMRNMGVKW